MTASPKMPGRSVGATKLLIRGAVMRCPVCGSKGLFRKWFELVERCPGCRFDFNREDGWWVGAMIMNTAGLLAMFTLVVGGGAAVTWPDVPWTLLEVVAIVAMAIFGIGFYPASKTLWLALDLLLHRMDDAR